MYGLAAVTLDGQPVEPIGSDRARSDGNSVIDTSRDAHLVLARGLAPGPHRLTVTNLGRAQPSGRQHGDGHAGVRGRHGRWPGARAARPGAMRWPCAAEQHGRQQAAELAAQVRDQRGWRPWNNCILPRAKWRQSRHGCAALHDRPPSSPMVERERKLWRPQPDTLDYFARSV